MLISKIHSKLESLLLSSQCEDGVILSGDVQALREDQWLILNSLNLRLSLLKTGG